MSNYLNTNYYLADSTTENGFIELTKSEYLNIFNNEENCPYAIQACRGEMLINEVLETKSQDSIIYEIGEIELINNVLHKVLITHSSIDNIPSEIIVNLLNKISSVSEIMEETSENQLLN